MDFVDAIAADYPIAVLARLLDTPEEMTPQLIAWGNEIVGFSDPEYARVLVNSEEAQKYRHLPFSSPVSQEIFEYGRKLAAERRGGDGEDLVSKLVNRIPEDGIPLSPEHFDNYFLLLVVAGNETTRQAISHSMKALIDNPDQMQWLVEQPRQDAGRRRGAAALGLAGLPLPPDRDARRRAARQDDQGGRQGRHVVRLGQPRRHEVRRPVRAAASTGCRTTT